MYILWNFTTEGRKSFALKMPRGIIFAKEKKKQQKADTQCAQRQKRSYLPVCFVVKKREFMRK